jgi:hypothetical protein
MERKKNANSKSSATGASLHALPPIRGLPLLREAVPSRRPRAFFSPDCCRLGEGAVRGASAILKAGNSSEFGKMLRAVQSVKRPSSKPGEDAGLSVNRKR